MQEDDRYYSIPLALLRAGTSALEVLEGAVRVGAVNAGKGYKVIHTQAEFQKLLEDARRAAAGQNLPTHAGNPKLFKPDGQPLPPAEAVELWDCALAGTKLLGIQGGCRTQMAQTWLNLHRHGDVYFRLKSRFLWSAVCTARHEKDPSVENPGSTISFREFRVLCAILSAPLNKLDFAFLGWESIQARACGYHNKALFKAGAAALPEHCQPLSRAQIRATCDTLEALNFFARVRYAAGRRGGYMAYSVRHDRASLTEAVKRWSQANKALKTKTSGHRAADLLAFLGAK